MKEKLSLIRKFMHNQRASIILDSYKSIIRENHRVIDIGSDTGFIAKKIQKQFNCKVECADIKNSLLYDFKFHPVKDFRIGARNKAFDIAMLNDTLHHIEFQDQRKIIKEAGRISRKVLVFESEFNFFVWLTEILNKKEGMPCPMAHRSLNNWSNFLWDYIYYQVKKPYYYPVKHYLFEVK